LGRKLTIAKAGDLIFYPPASDGAPSAATISILAPDGAALPTPVSNAAMSIDSVSPAVNGNPSKGDVSITLDDASSVAVGRSYVMEAGKQRERVLVRSVTGNVVTLASGLRVDHTDASTFKGHRLSYTVASGNTATSDRNYHAAISWTDEDGVVHDAGFTYHVVRQPWRLTTTDEAVLNSWPAADRQRHIRDREQGFDHELAEASELIALRYLRPHDYIEDQFLDTQPFQNLQVYLVRLLLVEQLWANDPDRLQAFTGIWQERADAEWERLSMRLPAYDSNNDGTIDADSEEGIRETAARHLPTSWQVDNPDAADTDDMLPRFNTVPTSERRRTSW